MTAPAHTLPGDVPGLLRRGSPIVCLKPEGDEPKLGAGLVQDVGPDGEMGRIVASWREPDGASGWDDEWFYETTTDRVALDLADPTGRIHALWFWEGLDRDQRSAAVRRGLGGGEGLRWAHVAGRVLHGDDLTPDDLDTLCRVLRAAVEVSRG